MSGYVLALQITLKQCRCGDVTSVLGNNEATKLLGKTWWHNAFGFGSGAPGGTMQVYYDPKQTTYERLLDVFFEHVDPTTLNRQGADRGPQYRSAICYHNPQQLAAAQKAIEEVNQKLQQNIFRKVLGSKVVTELQPAGDYYIAEKYHQKYLSRGGRFGLPQSAEKGCKDRIRCYG